MHGFYNGVSVTLTTVIIMKDEPKGLRIMYIHLIILTRLANLN